MRISPLNAYPYQIDFKRQIPLKNTNINFGSDNTQNLQRTSEPNLNTYMPLMSTKLKVNDNLRFFLNSLNTIDTDDKRKKAPIQIADIGCCDGALCRTLSEFLPASTKYYGLDLSEKMLEAAREIDNKKGRSASSTYVTGNAFGLPFKDNPMDAIIASSMIHELYSYEDKEYGEEAYSKKSIYNFMQQAYDCLKPGGILIIKDPATPGSDAYMPIKIRNANTEDGAYPPFDNDESLKKADITKLCTLDKLKRFCMDFYPAKGNCEWDGDECTMPKWLAVEFIRHRKWLATPENWEYEIKENYGTLTPDEMCTYAHKIGFSIVDVHNLCIPNKNNIYAIREGEFEMLDSENEPVDLETFPMFLEVVLRKPRNDNGQRRLGDF